VIKALEEGKTGVQIGENNNLFDFTYVENVAHAHLLAARALLVTATNPTLVRLDHERVDGEAFFITNGQPVPFWDFTRAIWRAAGSNKGVSHVWQLPRDLGLLIGGMFEVISFFTGKPPTINRGRIVYSTMTRYYDISKARRRLGYEPIVGLQEGVTRAVNWTLEQKKNIEARAQPGHTGGQGSSPADAAKAIAVKS
jgi:sterol-4alpha-carboxylate 3-dehydrogenase (decarboxylating)